MAAGLGRGLGAAGVRAGSGGSLAAAGSGGSLAAAGNGGTRRGQTGGRWTLTTAERPPCTTASASLSTRGSSAGSDTVAP